MSIKNIFFSRGLIQWKYLGLFIMLCLLIYYIFQIDLDLVVDSLSNFWAVFGLVLLTSFLAYLVATWGWQYCFKNQATSLSRLFDIRLIGEMLSLMNPTSVIAGDGFKCYLLAKQGLERTDVLNSVLMSRVLTVLSFVLLAIISSMSIIFLGYNEHFSLLIVALITTILAVSAFTYVLFSPSLLLFRIFKTIGINKIRIVRKNQILRKLKEVNLSSAHFFKHSKISLFKSFVLYLIHWLFGALEIYLVLCFLNIELVFFDALFIECGVVFMKSALAFIPGQIGVEELTNKVILGMLGTTNPVAWLVLSVVRRARFIFWLAFALVLYYVKYLGFNNKMLSSRLNS